MDDTTIEAAKAALRAQAHRQRAQFLEAHRSDAATAVADLFFAEVPLAPEEVVAAYWPIRDELDCRPIVARLVDEGWRVCLPVVVGPEQPLAMRLWQQGAPLYPAGFGTLAPDESAPLATPDLVLVPLLGFDRLGTRLGYGGGYYDRTVAAMQRKPRLVGFAFAAQEVDLVPRAAHDLQLDAVITEHGVRHFTGQAAAP
ncbi:5-formyltetrahydrofolate cyclo-ligase [Devosia sp.]|uniref:5-formyltetrahydrofolate cyclo-ligase n=1 Tax=Devosia sp. TaxID=1871048 RepID=UPI002F0F33E8